MFRLSDILNLMSTSFFKLFHNKTIALHSGNNVRNIPMLNHERATHVLCILRDVVAYPLSCRVSHGREQKNTALTAHQNIGKVSHFFVCSVERPLDSP